MDKVKGCSFIEGDSLIAELRKNALVMRTSLSERKPTTFCANVLPQVPHNYPQDKYVKV